MRPEVFTLHLESENSLSFVVRDLDGQIQPREWYRIRQYFCLTLPSLSLC